MDENDDIINIEELPEEPRRRKRNFVWRLLGALFKTIGVTITVAIVIVVVTISSVLWLLSPERLTPIIEKVASDNLKANVEVGKAELTFWSSFPELKLEVDDLEIVSRTLDSIPESLRRSLPANADSLVGFHRLHGALNVPKLLSGEIALNNVLLDRPNLNLLMVNDSINNFDIIPESNDTTETKIPKITINHFEITNAKPFRYRALADSIDVKVFLTNISVPEYPAPRYHLKLASNIKAPFFEEYKFDDIDVAFDASIGWDIDRPTRVEVRNLTVESDGIQAVINTDVDFNYKLEVENFHIALNNLSISNLKKHLPDEISSYVKPLDTNIVVDLNAKLNKPLQLASNFPFPPATVYLNVHPGWVKYENISLDDVSGNFEIHTVESGLDDTTVDITKLNLGGQALSLAITAKLADLFSDPKIIASITGDVNFDKLHPDLVNLMQMRVGGQLKANTTVDMRVSDLNRDRFHKMKVNGDVSLNNFRMTTFDSITSVYARRSFLEFGSDRSFNGASGVVDSLLVVKLRVDTAMFRTEGVYTTLSDFQAGIGTQNKANSADTAQINPLGGGLSIGKLFYLSTGDSLRAYVQNLKGGASLQRWQNNAKIPRLGLKFNAARMRVGDSKFRTSVRDADISIIANMRPRRNRKGAATDSVGRPLREHHGRRQALTIDQLDSLGVETIELDIDNTLRSLIFRWDVTGSIKAKRGTFAAPVFPLRSRLKNVNVDFTTDSVNIYDTQYKVGHSDFKINGYVAGIRGALNTRRPRPIRINFDVASDSININELVQALAYDAPPEEEYPDRPDLWDIDETDDMNEALGEDIELNKPIIIPVNIDALVKLRANTVIYADLVLNKFKGEVEAFAGAVKLNRLSAENELGKFNVTALYSAPKADDISLGLGLMLKGIHISRLKNFIPHVDSVMPMIKSMSGVVNANVAITARVLPNMDVDLRSVKAVFKFDGDSLVVFDNETFRKLAKWLLFKNKNRNMIDSISVEAVFEDNMLKLYPFIVNIDRYRLGVMGHSNLEDNLDYHISVLKSPVPFKFGINIKGSFEHPKFRFGGAKFKDNMVAQSVVIADTARVNLIKEIDQVFARGIRAARLGPLRINAPDHSSYMNRKEEAISHEDSILMINEGFIEPPDTSSISKEEDDVSIPAPDNQPRRRRR